MRFTPEEFKARYQMEVEPSGLRVMRQAPIQARMFQHNYIGTEHLLRAVAIVDSTILPPPVSAKSIYAAIENTVGRGDHWWGSVEDIELSSRAEMSIELGVAAALELRDPFLLAEHIVWGLVAEGKNMATAMIVNQGVSLDSVIHRLLERHDRASLPQQAERTGLDSLDRLRTILADPQIAEEQRHLLEDALESLVEKYSLK